MTFNVIVKPKEAVLDPQGNAVRDAMRHLGMPEVKSVRIGKYMEISLDSKDGNLEKRLRGLCRDLLSNPVIEDYELQKSAASGPSRTGGEATVTKADRRQKSAIRNQKLNGAKSKIKSKRKSSR